MSDVNKTIPIEKKIGERIGMLRSSMNESQQHLANALNEAATIEGMKVSREIINHWERGTRHIKADHLIALADHFGVSVDYLLWRDTEKTPNTELRAICKYTGLSSDVISKLHDYNKGGLGSALIHQLDHLICLEGFDGYLSAILSLGNMVHTMKGYCDRVEENTFTVTDQFGSHAGAFNREYQVMRLTRFNASEASSDIIEDLFEYRSVNKRCDEVCEILMKKEKGEIE